MSASALLALALGLVPLGSAPLESPDPDLGVDLQVAGVAVAASEDQLAVQAPLVGPVTVQACDTCTLPDLRLGPGADADAGTSSGDGSAKSSWPQPPDLTPPQAVAATSLSAILLGALAWVLPRLALGLPLLGFSRIDDDALARHPARQLALQFITANPGANIQDVRRALGVAWGTAVYHLSRLERGGLVAVRHVAGERRHWPLGAAPARDALAPTSHALAALVKERPGLAQAELARLAGLGAPAACKQLARLESAGLVQARRDGRLRRYVGTERLAAVLAPPPGRPA